MAITIKSAGLLTPGGLEDRDLIVMDIEYNGNTYAWSIYTVAGQSITDTIEGSLTSIEQRISSQLAAGEEPTPDVPDYYAKRRAEYPSIGDQLGALYKGIDSPEYAAMQAKIQAVKDKYPKP